MESADFSLIAVLLYTVVVAVKQKNSNRTFLRLCAQYCVSGFTARAQWFG